MLKNIFKNNVKAPIRGNCSLCGKTLDDRSSSLKYTTDEMEEVEYGEICGSCSDILDDIDSGIYDVEVEDESDD